LETSAGGRNGVVVSRIPLTVRGFFGLVLLTVLLAGCFAQGSQGKAGGDGQKYVLATVPRFAKTWSVSEFDRQVIPNFYKTATHAQTEKFFNAFRRRLGPLQALSVAKSVQKESWFAGTGSVIAQQYLLNARFAKAPGTIRIEVDDISGAGWKISQFYVDSDAFLK
jgi:hypothetical protein